MTDTRQAVERAELTIALCAAGDPSAYDIGAEPLARDVLALAAALTETERDHAGLVDALGKARERIYVDGQRIRAAEARVAELEAAITERAEHWEADGVHALPCLQDVPVADSRRQTP